jgi:5'-3' exonuclease
MQWVLDYYTSPIPSWTWSYRYHYSPFLAELAIVAKTFKPQKYPKSQPLLPFQQLLCILPPQSASLLPIQLAPVFENLPSEFPLEFQIDFSGKKFTWQAIALLPFIDIDNVLAEYEKYIKECDPSALVRNVFGKAYSYRHDEKLNKYTKSPYGIYISHVLEKII